MLHYPSPTQMTPQLAGMPVEALDKAGRPLMVMPFANVLAHKLAYGMSVGILRENAPSGDSSSMSRVHAKIQAGRVPRSSGKNRKIYLRRVHTPTGSVWDIINGPVQAGEAYADAFIRLLHEQLPQLLLSHDSLHTRLLQSWHLPDMGLFASLFAVWTPIRTSDLSAYGIFVDEQELAGLLQSCPEILSPTLHWAASTQMLFTGGKGELL